MTQRYRRWATSPAAGGVGVRWWCHTRGIRCRYVFDGHFMRHGRGGATPRPHRDDGRGWEALVRHRGSTRRCGSRVARARPFGSEPPGLHVPVGESRRQPVASRHPESGFDLRPPDSTIDPVDGVRGAPGLRWLCRRWRTIARRGGEAGSGSVGCRGCRTSSRQDLPGFASLVLASGRCVLSGARGNPGGGGFDCQG